ncbi:MAG: alpha/beta fold hydrolase [Opitutaceae bacterium]|nr:alpha/beta fold hydrolase [Opitutaceae bacterium]
MILLGALGFITVSAFFPYRFTNPPRRPLAVAPETFLTAHEDVHFAARDGVTLDGWFVPCADTKKAVVLLHGYGTTRTQMLARAKFFHDHGYAALLYDARGHGKSDGDLVGFGFFETRDLLGALDWLRDRGFTQFGSLGASQGGATIALAATDLREVRWAILESVYPTLTNAVDRRFRRTVLLPAWLAGCAMIPIAEWRLGVSAETISPREAIARLPCPVFVISGELDTHTLPANARELFDHAREPKSWWLVPGAAHVDIYGFAKADYEKRLLEFVSKAESMTVQ